MSRMSRHEHAVRYSIHPVKAKRRPPNKAKRRPLNKQEMQRLVNRLVKRDALARGLIDPSKGKYRWQWHYNNASGEVEANSRSEARSLIKRALGLPKRHRLPEGVQVFKVGIVEGRDFSDFPFEPIIGEL